MISPRYGLLVFVFAAICGQWPVRAGDLPTPEVFCKENPTDDKCMSFLGSSTKFNSFSGNIGNTQSSRTNSRYIIFLHAGGGERTAAEKLSKDLQTRGFTVRGIDDGIDAVGGQGVDYFNEQDKSAAQDVAQMANAVLPKVAPQLVPRLQKVTNPTGFLGVWLYKKN